MRWNKINTIKQKAYRCKDTNYELFDEWAKGKGITHWADRYSNYQTHFPNLDYLMLPMIDHVLFFKNDVTKELRMTSQPYCTFETNREEILKWCEDNNMVFEFFDGSKSWYYPGHTSLIIFKHKNIKI